MDYIVYITNKNNLEVIYSQNNIKIKDSYKIKEPIELRKTLEEIYKIDPYKKIRKRTFKSALREWKTHNILYKYNLFLSHTRDCDITEGEEIYRRIVYFFLGRF